MGMEVIGSNETLREDGRCDWEADWWRDVGGL